MQMVLRFVVGGTLVSLFAVLGDVLKPKGFAGLFSGAPSVALATLGLTIYTQGASYAATEAKSMIAGALAFCLYAALCIYMMAIKHIRAAPATISGLLAWGLGAALLFSLLEAL